MVIETDIQHIGTDEDPNGHYSEGDDANFSFETTDTNDEEVDLSNISEAVWFFSHSKHNKSSIVEKTLTGGDITVDNDDGNLNKQSRVVVSISGSDTDEYGGDEYYHELEITDSAGSKETASKGDFKIQPSPNDP